MQVLSYSPKVEAYAKSRRGVVDLSGDIVDLSVSRVVDGSSTFSAKLQNKGGKYNGLFGCFDPIVIYATKSERVKLFTGYITSFDVFKLYNADFSISGLCTLYRLQQLYWDPQLMSSQKLMRNTYRQMENFDNGCVEIAERLLTNVAGWPADNIVVQEKIPDGAIEWAAELYAMKADDVVQARQMVDEFYEILQTHGPSAVSGHVESSGKSSGGLSLSGDDAKASDAQKALVEKATGGTVPGSCGWCLQWVQDVYESAGYPFYRYDFAVDVWRNRESHDAYGEDLGKIPLGSCVVTSGSGSSGAGHIGIYIGGGQVISEVGGQRTESLDSFGSWATDWIDGQSGTYGWVCPSCGIDWK